jgi:hypothetical protein
MHEQKTQKHDGREVKRHVVLEEICTGYGVPRDNH